MSSHDDYAHARARLLVGSYRITKADNPSKFVMALGIVLALFDESVIAEATSPATGIASTMQFSLFPPNPAELRRFCDDIVRRRARINHEEVPPGFDPPPYSRHYDHVGNGSPAPCPADQARVAAALAAYRAAINPIDPPPQPPWRSPTDEDLYRRYGRRAADPNQPIPFD